MTLAVYATAEAQALKAAGPYDRLNPGKGDDSLLELRSVYRIIESIPSLHPRVYAPRSRDEYRVHVMKRFMYNVYFRVRFDDLRVVAIVHQRRRKNYWTRDLP